MSLPARCVHRKPQSTSIPKQQKNVCNFGGPPTLRQRDSWLAFPHQSHPMKWAKHIVESILKRCVGHIFSSTVLVPTLVSQMVIFIIIEATPFQEMQISYNSWFLFQFWGWNIEDLNFPHFYPTLSKPHVSSEPQALLCIWGALKWFMRSMSSYPDSAIASSWVSHTNSQRTNFLTCKPGTITEPHWGMGRMKWNNTYM